MPVAPSAGMAPAAGGGGELGPADSNGRAGASALAAVAQIGGREGKSAIGIEKDRQVGGAGGQGRSGRQRRRSITGSQAHCVGDRIDQVPISIHGVDHHPKTGAHNLAAGCAGLAAGGARRAGLARDQQLQLRERRRAHHDVGRGDVGQPAAGEAQVDGVGDVVERLAKVATPLTAVALNAPCRVPLPALRATVTTVELSLLRRLPY